MSTEPLVDSEVRPSTSTPATWAVEEKPRLMRLSRTPGPVARSAMFFVSPASRLDGSVAARRPVPVEVTTARSSWKARSPVARRVLVSARLRVAFGRTLPKPRVAPWVGFARS